jgi:hypothetical protein
LTYDLSPQCMVAFKRVPNPAIPGTSLINWRTIGFPRVVDRSEIPREEITATRQSNFAPNQVDQIWMAPDGTAHVQVPDIIMTTPGGVAKRDVLALDNITGAKALPPGPGGVVCPVITDVRRQGHETIIESETQPTQVGQGGDPCDPTVLSFSVPTCD